jgi:hypothetical protein
VAHNPARCGRPQAGRHSADRTRDHHERIEVRNGGTALVPITISAMPGARVIVSGADCLPDGWSPVAGLDGAYSHDWGLRFPINGPNGLTRPAGPEHELTGARSR